MYTGRESNYTEVNGRVVRCYYDIDSMYFDAPANLTLVLEGYGGAVIEIPLVISR